MRATRTSLLLALSLLCGCDRAGSADLSGKVEPVVAPPDLERVKIEPPTIARTTTSQVVLRDPSSLAATQVDLYKQADGVVDILWIVDTTGSMDNERRSLADNFDHFIATLTTLKTRYHIGVTSTDMSLTGERGALRGTVKVIDNATPDPKAVFLANTTFPPSRKRWSQSLRAMVAALTDPALNAPGMPNSGFLRPGAALAVIVVSDGDDESIGEVPYYSRLLRSVKGPGYENLISFSAIAGTVPDGCWPPGEETFFGSKAAPAVRLTDMVRRTGGVFASICDKTFESSLIRIAQALNTLKRIFPLSLKADPGTLSVMVNGVPIPKDPVNGWTWRPEINSIAFEGDFVPPPGAEVRLFYAIDQGP